MRRDQRISLADFERHHAENDSAGKHARFIGYGAMLLESFVGVMAMVAACAMQPGVYFAINSPASIVGATPEAATQTIIQLGLSQ